MRCGREPSAAAAQAQSLLMTVAVVGSAQTMNGKQSGFFDQHSSKSSSE